MELLQGGDLFDRVVARGHYSEGDARDIVSALVDAIAQLHHAGAAHKDLRLETILLADHRPPSSETIKICELESAGLQRAFATLQGIPYDGYCSSCYLAPEILEHATCS